MLSISDLCNQVSSFDPTYFNMSDNLDAQVNVCIDVEHVHSDADTEVEDNVETGPFSVCIKCIIFFYKFM